MWGPGTSAWLEEAPEGLGGARWHEALIQREGFFPGGAMDCDGPLGTVGCCGISHARPLRVSVPRASLGSQGGPGDGLEAGGFSGVGRGHRDSLSPWGRCREPFLSPILFPSVSRPPRSCLEMPLSAAGFAASLGGAGSVGHSAEALGLPSKWQAGGDRGRQCRHWPGVPLASWGHEAQGQPRSVPGALS